MSNFTLTLRLDTERFQEDILNKRLEISRQFYNACLGELYKRYNFMRQSKEYRKVSKMSKDKDRNKKFNELNKKYGLTEYSLHTYVKPMQHIFKKNIDSMTAQKIATRCFSAFQKVMFHQASKVKFKKYGEMNSVEGKSNSSGIRFKDNMLFWNKLKIPVVIKKNDLYAQMALENKVKYCRIVRKMIRGKYKFYLQLVIEGVPPIKLDKETGEVKHHRNEGRVGIDIGTQTVVIVSKNEAKLLELAPDLDNIEKEKRILQRKLDRQRRTNNPHKYNENGTIKKSNEKWIESKKYLKTKNKLAELQRVIADKRKQEHNKLANWVLSLGDEVYVETINYKGLQAKSKNITINKNTGRFNSKKRFGKSLANKAPSMFLTILDNKLKWQNKELKKIDTYNIKASQYNHIEDSYIKKGLSERWNDFGEFKIQRDLYSAFLIMCTKDCLKKTDKEMCINEFDNFRMLHDLEIERIKTNKSKLISSMGI